MPPRRLPWATRSGIGNARIRVAFPRPLVAGVFLSRANRFAAEVRVAGQRWRVHLPNSGRMEELLRRGAAVRVLPTPFDGRRTQGRMVVVRHRGRWVGVDSHLPNRLWEAALRQGGLPPVVGVEGWDREVRLGTERVDFRVHTAHGVWWVETKSCNRVIDGVALFPDAPTVRGARHLRALTRVARKGAGAAIVVWFVQRPDARILRVDHVADPAFAAAARQAVNAGVRLIAYTCTVTLREIAVARPVPVYVGPRHGSC